MKEKFENTQKCEFLLELGKNIICQRYFTVRNFNPKAIYSLDLHHTVSYIIDKIESSLVFSFLVMVLMIYRLS